MALLTGGTSMGRNMYAMEEQRRASLVYNDRKHSIANNENDTVCGCSPRKHPKPKKTSKAMRLRERIRQFSTWFYETEEVREATHIKRRLTRQRHRKAINNLTLMKWVRLVFFIDLLLWIVGGVLTVCSTVEVIGTHTPIYEHKERYRLVGPILVGLAVIVLFINVGCKHKILIDNKLRKRPKEFYIVGRKPKKSGGNDKSKERSPLDSVERGVSGLPAARETEMKDMSREHLLKYGKEDVSFQMVAGATDSSATADFPKSKINNTANIFDEQRSNPTAAQDIKSKTNTDNQKDAKRKLLHKQSSFASCDSSIADANDAIQGHVFSRGFSVRSKTSEISNFSNFSETAPLVK